MGRGVGLCSQPKVMPYLWTSFDLLVRSILAHPFKKSCGDHRFLGQLKYIFVALSKRDEHIFSIIISYPSMLEINTNLVTKIEQQTTKFEKKNSLRWQTHLVSLSLNSRVLFTSLVKTQLNFAIHIQICYSNHCIEYFLLLVIKNQRPEYKFILYSNFQNMISLGTINVTIIFEFSYSASL